MVYVSSTFEDLQEQRQAAITALHRLRVQVVAMEHYVADSDPAVLVCLDDVKDCDFYVGIFAWRYGTVLPDLDRSITELEYRQAVASGKQCFIFQLREDVPWPPIRMDRGAAATRVEALRAELRASHTVLFFTSSEDLAAKVTATLANALIERGAMPPSRYTLTAGVVQVYLARLERRYSRLNVNTVALPAREDQLDVPLGDVFVEQSVRHEPPPSELPREWLMRMLHEGQITADDLSEHPDADEVAHLRELYLAKPRQRLFDAIRDPACRTLVLLGDPGAGKSTVTGYLILVLARACNDDRLAELVDHLPLMVELREYDQMASRRECDDFLSYLDRLSQQDGLGLPEQDLRQYLSAGGRALIAFDGLDEIFERTRREAMARRIAEFAKAFPAVRVIVTSRIIGYSRRVLTEAGFAHFTLQDLDDGQIEDFLGRWFPRMLRDGAEAADRRRRLLEALRGSAALRELAGNPLLLTILAIISRTRSLPRDRWKLYAHATDVLVERWDMDRRLPSAYPDTGFLEAEDKKEMLRRLAQRMQGDGGQAAVNYVGPAELETVFGQYLAQHHSMDLAAGRAIAGSMIEQLHQRDFILSRFGPDLYSFVHRTFLEFFCADAIVCDFKHRQETRFPELLGLFLAHWTDASWREVLRLIASELHPPHVGTIVAALTNDVNQEWPPREFPSAPWNLALATQCLAEVRNPHTVGEPAAKLLQRLIMLLEHCVSINDRDTTRLIEEEILPAARALGPKWPGRDAYMHWYHRRGGRLLSSPVTEYAARFAAILSSGDDDADTLFAGLEAIKDSRAAYAVVAGLSELAARARAPERWGSSGPRALPVREMLDAKARYGVYGLVRVAAVQALGESFGEEPSVIRTLNELARMPDGHAGVRAAAVTALRAVCATDDSTRATIFACAQDGPVAVRRAALQLLGRRCGRGRDVTAVLLERLRLDDDPEAIRLAAQALTEHAPAGDELFRALIARLGPDQPAPVRRTAVQLLDDGAKRADVREPLLRLVRDDPDAAVFKAAADALADFGDAATSVRDIVMERGSGDRYDTARLAAIQIIAARFAREDIAQQMLIDRLRTDHNAAVRAAAAQLLGDIAGSEVEVADVMAAVVRHDASPEVRLIAVHALIDRIGLAPANRTMLTERAKHDQDPGVRLAIVVAMGRRGMTNPQARRLMLDRVAQDPSEAVRLAAVRALAPYRDQTETLEVLVDLVRRDLDAGVVEAAIEALAGVSDARGRVRRALLRRAARIADNATVRRVVVELLATRFVPLEEVRKALLDRVGSDPDPGVVEAAAEGLAGSGMSRDGLRERLSLRLDDPAVRGAAARALSRWFSASAEARQQIAERFGRESDAEIRRDLLAALVAFPEPDAEIRRALEAATRDGDWTIRTTAVRVLVERFGEQVETGELLRQMARDHPVGEFGRVLSQVITCLPGAQLDDLPTILSNRKDHGE